MNTDTSPDRDTELRRMLVTTVSATPLLRQRPSRKVIGAGIAAFVLAGALTGGAVASASASADHSGPDALASLATAVKGTTREANAVTVGKPFTRLSDSTQVIDLGVAPRSATTVFVGFECLSAGRFSTQLDDSGQSSQTCSSTQNIGSQTTEQALPLALGKHTFTVTSPDHGRYALWISWVDVRKVEPSFAQQNAILGGRITRDEYVQAFSRYVGCMDAAGFDLGTLPLDRPDLAAGGLPGEAVDSGADVRCSAREFDLVEAKWQDQGLK